ncbi:MAG: hypothetical protein NVSMB26_09440 [Beijerinckiaceae bacterium]
MGLAMKRLGRIILLLVVGMLATASVAQTAKVAKTKKPAAVSAEKLPCLRATWKDDPVCADAPDEHTLPTPSMSSHVPPRPPVEDVKIGAKWQANNKIASPTPRLVDTPGSDFQNRNTPPDTHVGVGLDMRF